MSDIREEIRENSENNTEKKPVEVYAERAEEKPQELGTSNMHALALAYARYLAENDLEPGDLTFTEPDEVTPEPEDAAPAEGPADEESPEEEISDQESSASDAPEEKKPAAKKKTGKKKKSKKSRKKTTRKTDAKAFAPVEISDEEAEKLGSELEEEGGKFTKIAVPVDIFDNLHDRAASGLAGLGRDFVRASHSITSTYRQSRRVIGSAILVIGVIAAIILAVFDKFTVYEYAYNGKILGYVNNQEDVIDVLDIAGQELTENSSNGTEIKFIPNQNVTFTSTDGRGKSIDDSDAALNKLVYMTDIETEAYGIYDGESLKAVVKDQDEAETLLEATRNELSTPDEGMTLVSSKFINELAIRPVNVLLTSVQSYVDARDILIEGGSYEVYHIVEADETLISLAAKFGIDPVNIYDESNTNVVTEIEQGDTVCIHVDSEPVQVQMVETGKMKEVIPFETVKKNSKKYYKGDTHIKQKGIDRVQIFEGTITKVSGEVTDRDAKNIDVITEGQDKIILIGTAERPKTAPTGTYIVPLRDYEGITSNFGYRWGRLHSGIDMGASRGTPIYATDGGTIQRAGWYYGYGLCVEIDHGNGRMTRYGHCSALLVNVGDQVYQGQNIALVGNTGHSFGNHLHFEINFNGSPVNPRPYLGI